MPCVAKEDCAFTSYYTLHKGAGGGGVLCSMESCRLLQASPVLIFDSASVTPTVVRLAQRQEARNRELELVTRSSTPRIMRTPVVEQNTLKQMMNEFTSLTTFLSEILI